MFKDRLAPIVEQEWAKSVNEKRLTDEEKSEPIPKIPINFWNASIKSMLAEESDEVRAEVEAWRDSKQQDKLDDLKSKADGVESESEETSMAEKYHRYVFIYSWPCMSC